MSDIILWRHADAEPGLPDLERKLTRKGKKQAARMGAWLDQQLPDSCKVLCSPAQRALQTVEGLGRKFKVCPPLAPDMGVESALQAIQAEPGKLLLVVGHQPTLGQVAALLLSGQPQYWSVKKGAVWWLRHCRREDAQVLLHAVQGPDGL